MNRYSLILIALLSLAAAEVQAQQVGAFARLGFGARGMAMSNALVADDGGHTSPYYNPALAPFTVQQNISASAAFLSLDRELQFLQFATPLKPRAGLAAGLIHAGVSNIDGRDGSGYHTGDFSTDEFAFFLAFGVGVGSRASIGAGFSFFNADYFEGLSPVSSIALDLGLTVQVTEALRLGAAFDDLLARYSWNTSDIYGSDGNSTSDRFPARLRFGGAYTLMNGQARITAEYESRITSSEIRGRDVVFSIDGPRQTVTEERLLLQQSFFRVGAEYQPLNAFAVRAGVDGLGAQEIAGARPSAGFMVEQSIGELRVRGEYAFVLEPYAVGSMHLITLRMFL